jgi:phenylacetate-CoA ligase
MDMNLRKVIFFELLGLRGQPLKAYYDRFAREDQNGIPPDTTKNLLIQLLEHCRQSVPYYAETIDRIGGSFYDDPKEYLRRFPILTKEIMRSRFDELKSNDLAQRRWHYETSGGSTGEPARFIQDWEYAVRSGAITLLFSKLIGREIGQCEVNLWGSVRDITKGAETWKARLVNKLTHTIFVNAFRMNPEKMLEFINIVNTKRPKLIISYVDSIYNVAKFAEQAGLSVAPQAALICTAGTLYPLLREKIGQVFQCKVFNRYGSREVGDIACERPMREGLWIAPWGNYVEVVDEQGNPLPDGTEGEILVTSLTNFAMPLIRYRIGDRGILSPGANSDRDAGQQVLQQVSGRTCDSIITKNGDFIHYGYFMVLLFFKDWISQYQVIQKNVSSIIFKIVKSKVEYQPTELNEIREKTRLVMGNDCDVVFEFVDEIPPNDSGKYRYTISEVQNPL